MTNTQPRLPIGIADEWRLDEQTKEIGRRGVALARVALAEAARRAAEREAARQRDQNRAA
jgi:hypothetical protein